MTDLPIQSILEAALNVIEKRGISYMIMGGFAVRALGIPRPTYDADLTIESDEPSLQGLFEALMAEGFLIPDEHRRGFRDTLSGMSKVKVQKFEQRHVWDLDLFLVTTEYQKAAFARRRQVRFLGSARWLISAEDLVIHKLLANRRKDLLDIEEILRLSPPLDNPYMNTWCENLGIKDRLDRALEEKP